MRYLEINFSYVRRIYVQIREALSAFSRHSKLSDLLDDLLGSLQIGEGPILGGKV